MGYPPGHGTNVGNKVCANAYVMQQFQQYQQASGDYNGRGAAPQSYVQALLKWDANAAGVIFPGAAGFMTIPVNTIDNRTGAVPDVSSSPYYAYVNYSGLTSMAQTGPYQPNLGCWDTYPNSGHWPEAYYIPYIF